jgi:hypothetical protein
MFHLLWLELRRQECLNRFAVWETFRLQRRLIAPVGRRWIHAAIPFRKIVSLSNSKGCELIPEACQPNPPDFVQKI